HSQRDRRVLWEYGSARPDTLDPPALAVDDLYGGGPRIGEDEAIVGVPKGQRRALLEPHFLDHRCLVREGAIARREISNPPAAVSVENDRVLRRDMNVLENQVTGGRPTYQAAAIQRDVV